MTRFQKVAAITVALTFLLVMIGVIVRATDSGLGCPDWPLCHGQLLPALGDDKAWIEWLHRTVAAVLGLLVLGLAVLAVRDHRRQASILWPSIAAVGLVGFQAWLGRETVRLGNTGESVTAHLAAAMTLLALLIYILVRSFYPARIGGRGREPAVHAARGLRGGLGLRAAAVRVPGDGDRRGPGLPRLAADGRHVLPGADRRRRRRRCLHRWVAVVVGVIVAAVAVVALRRPRAPNRVAVRLAMVAARALSVQAIVGAAQIWTRLDPLDADAPPRARRVHLGRARRAGRRLRTTRPGSPARRRARNRGRGLVRAVAAGTRDASATRCAPTSR